MNWFNAYAFLPTGITPANESNAYVYETYGLPTGSNAAFYAHRGPNSPAIEFRDLPAITLENINLNFADELQNIHNEVSSLNLQNTDYYDTDESTAEFDFDEFMNLNFKWFSFLLF